MEKQNSGIDVIDSLLNGGYEKQIITTIYGPSSSGKTCFCIIAAIQTVKQGKKVIFIDTEASFSVERAIQLFPEFTQNLDNFIFFKPTSFAQQKLAIIKLGNLVNQNIGLIVVDSIAMFYRLEIAQAQDYSEVNKDMNQQLLHLLKIAREQSIPILITNQVYANFENRSEVNMVGGDLIKYTSKCILELKKFNKLRKAIVKRHRALPEGKMTDFVIKEKGVFGSETSLVQG